MESMQLFTLFYLIFAFCMVYPIPVFISVGLTVESLFSKFLKSEIQSFVIYQMKRIVATIFLHSCLPLGYVALRIYLDPDIRIAKSVFWQFLLIGSLTLAVTAVFVLRSWINDNFGNHPFMAKMKVFADNQSIQDVIRSINNEFMGPERVVIECNSTCKVVGTRSWIIKASAYDLDIAHLSDASLQVMDADEHSFAYDHQGSVQFLKIKVTSARPDVKPFFIRINSTSLRDLQDTLPDRISISNNVKVKSTLNDLFVTAFKEQVKLNPRVTIQSPIEDDCWVCCERRPDVKLVRSCGDYNGPDACTSCFCRPMWCVDCMGNWFASRQDASAPDQWMSAKCPCPMCRSNFCVLDVCYINEEIETTESLPAL